MKHGLRAEKFFSDEEKKRIRETTRSIESGTVGEVAVMVVESSEHYFDAEVVGAILLSGSLSLAIAALHFHSSVWWYIPIAFLLFFPSRLMFRRFPVFKAILVSSHRKEHAVRLRAVRAFYEKGLHKTKGNTGILFFISVLERKVRVLADSGIHEKIGQETLNRFAREVSSGIKNGRACDALCAAMKDAGELLSQHFPVTADDTNQLPDDVIT